MSRADLKTRVWSVVTSLKLTILTMALTALVLSGALAWFAIKAAVT